MEVRQFERAVRDAEGKLAQVILEIFLTQLSIHL